MESAQSFDPSTSFAKEVDGSKNGITNYKIYIYTYRQM